MKCNVKDGTTNGFNMRNDIITCNFFFKLRKEALAFVMLPFSTKVTDQIYSMYFIQEFYLTIRKYFIKGKGKNASKRNR